MTSRLPAVASRRRAVIWAGHPASTESAGYSLAPSCFRFRVRGESASYGLDPDGTFSRDGIETKYVKQQVLAP